MPVGMWRDGQRHRRDRGGRLRRRGTSATFAAPSLSTVSDVPFTAMRKLSQGNRDSLPLLQWLAAARVVRGWSTEVVAPSPEPLRLLLKHTHLSLQRTLEASLVRPHREAPTCRGLAGKWPDAGASALPPARKQQAFAAPDSHGPGTK